jgi:hypothetical protein
MSSGLPLKADIARCTWHVANVPTTEMSNLIRSPYRRGNRRAPGVPRWRDVGVAPCHPALNLGSAQRRVGDAVESPIAATSQTRRQVAEVPPGLVSCGADRAPNDISDSYVS